MHLLLILRTHFLLPVYLQPLSLQKRLHQHAAVNRSIQFSFLLHLLWDFLILHECCILCPGTSSSPYLNRTNYSMEIWYKGTMLCVTRATLTVPEFTYFFFFIFFLVLITCVVIKKTKQKKQATACFNVALMKCGSRFHLNGTLAIVIRLYIAPHIFAIDWVKALFPGDARHKAAGENAFNAFFRIDDTDLLEWVRGRKTWTSC